jgi:hypothetical protein
MMLFGSPQSLPKGASGNLCKTGCSAGTTLKTLGRFHGRNDSKHYFFV